MSLYQLKRKTDINIDKIRVVEQILDFVDYEINENKEKFTNNEVIVSKNLWDAYDTQKASHLFPKEFWERMRTKIRPTTFITGSYNKYKHKHEFHWLNGSAFNMAQFELKKKGIDLQNKTENKIVTWTIQKCEPVKQVYYKRRWERKDQQEKPNHRNVKNEDAFSLKNPSQKEEDDWNDTKPLKPIETTEPTK